jgi:leucyl-tRNA synthetase
MQSTKADSVTFFEIDQKQQKRWEEAKLFAAPRIPVKGKKFYGLDMFPYPSGDGLHVGHPEGYTASDIIARKRMMSGYSVLRPMGWDAFGLPAENYALETGVHPAVTTRRNTDTFRGQIKSLGLAYDWNREINTTDPEYYKWTQWIFLQLFKKGLAYENTMPINWCPSCKTGLANEEVFGGKCERCDTPIEHKSMRQWMLRITAYADRLLSDLDMVDWPESTLTMQKNWIGRSEGAEIDFAIDASQHKLRVFTTRPDTLYGATYMVIAPEHPLADALITSAQRAGAKAYIEKAAAKTEFERSAAELEKTGVFSGSYAINPVNGAKIPVWIADYVLAGYGTGAIMAVPAHDERDYAFAKKFNLPVIEVVKAPADWKEDGCFSGDGIAVNSEAINGLSTPEAKKKIIAFLEDKKIGHAKITYRLRDWLFARQRYWGEPIPLVHCPKCGIVPVPESELPLKLPEVDKFQPSGTGESPLANIDSWVNTKCPACGGPAKRETNTMPQWAGSCWYYLRYLDPKNTEALVDREIEKSWMPVDCYIGGAEHAVMHLLYARFWHKVLYDIGVVSTKEPFMKLRHQGMILSFSYRDSHGVYHPYKEIDFGADGKARLKATGEELASMMEKMSKSKKSVINPNDMVREHGADATRMYEMFMGPFEAQKPWDVKGMEGITRFLKRVWFWSDGIMERNAFSAPENRQLEILRHKTTAKVSDDIESMRFNTAISAMMIYFNELHPQEQVAPEHLETLLKLLHPFAPHMTEELWQRWGKPGFLVKSEWPSFDKSLLADEEIEIGVQINGKVRGRLRIPAGMDASGIEKMARAAEFVRKHSEGKTIAKVIVVPGRIVSIIVK